MRLVQYTDNHRVAAAIVRDADTLEPLNIEGGVYALAVRAIATRSGLAEAAAAVASGDRISYARVVENGALLPPVAHPDPARCLIAGTGLTHLGSADTRDAMHVKLNAPAESLTDSMKMFKLGVENGKPALGAIGAQPEWFYKGDGSILVAPGQPIPVPGFAADAGEEPELVGIYLIGDDGTPHRLGFAQGNEFSDHVTERANYLWLAHSKLRPCSFGPELRIGDLPQYMEGYSRIQRDGRILWEKPFLTGEANMCHAIANLEHHHFKYAQFCRPGDLHVHFLGTSTLSFGDGVRTEPGDSFEISLPEFGRPLRNPLSFTPAGRQAVAVAVAVL